MSTESTTQESNATQLYVSDLQQLAVIVDIAFRKGVFNAEEAAPVSALYTKLMFFLKQFEHKASEVTATTSSTEINTKE
jgi:TRAP-type C4-dicarboxylate transport system permease large subunit